MPEDNNQGGGQKAAQPQSAKPQPPKAQPQPGANLVEAVVQRGTVVWGAGPYNQERKCHWPPAQKALPGQKVRLPREEVAALRARGILVDPNNAVTMGQGPNFAVEDRKPVEKLTPDNRA